MGALEKLRRAVAEEGLEHLSLNDIRATVEIVDFISRSLRAIDSSHIHPENARRIARDAITKLEGA